MKREKQTTYMKLRSKISLIQACFITAAGFYFLYGDLIERIVRRCFSNEEKILRRQALSLIKKLKKEKEGITVEQIDEFLNVIDKSIFFYKATRRALVSSLNSLKKEITKDTQHQPQNNNN